MVFPQKDTQIKHMSEPETKRPRKRKVEDKKSQECPAPKTEPVVSVQPTGWSSQTSNKSPILNQLLTWERWTQRSSWDNKGPGVITCYNCTTNTDFDRFKAGTKLDYFTMNMATGKYEISETDQNNEVYIGTFSLTLNPPASIPKEY